MFFKTVQNGEQLFRRHAFGLVHLVIKVVAIAHLARKAITQADQRRESVIDQPLLQIAQRLLRTAAVCLVVIGGLIDQQFAQRGGNPLALLIKVGRLMGFAAGKQIVLRGD